MSKYRMSRVEVWPIAADVAGFWLLGGKRGAWDPGVPTEARLSTHEAVVEVVEAFGADDVTKALHSTSWRPDTQPAVDVFTYIACVDAGQAVIDRWPAARPIGRVLLESVGKPYHHDPTEPPLPRFIDVAAHAIRHIRLLTNPHCDAFDASTYEAIASLPGEETGRSWWLDHLEGLKGQLAGLYRPEPGWVDGVLVESLPA